MSWNRTITNDLTDATALVADANNATRSVMLSQLRALGVRSIRQASRASDARRHLLEADELIQGLFADLKAMIGDTHG